MPRGFGPTRIEHWLEQADELASRRSSSDLGFLIAFTAWEALQCRILAIALRRQGYSMSVAHEYLGKTVHNDRQSVRMNFKLVFLRKPDQLRGLGKGWRTIEAHRQTRNRLAHGLGTVNPIKLRVITGEIIHLLSDTTWIEQTPLPETLGDPGSRNVEIGPVMNQLKRSATNGHSVQQLASKLRHLRKGQ